MSRAASWLLQTLRGVVENKQQAILAVIIFTLLPFASWLAVAITALVTLRKGQRAGLQVLLFGIVAYGGLALKSVSLGIAFYSACLQFIPAFLAAICLRTTASWRLSFGVLFLQACGFAFFMQYWLPELFTELLMQFKLFLSALPKTSSLESLQQHLLVNENLLGHIWFGFQLASIVLSGAISLLFARYLQANCFFPGGFRKEMQAFRSGKIALFLLIACICAAYNTVLIAVDLLPLLLLYFLFAGYCLVYAVVKNKTNSKAMFVVFICLLIKPIIMLLIYIVFGTLDSLFNFRLYLVKARKSV